MVRKSTRDKYRKLLNTLSGYIVIISGVLLLYNFISGFSSELGSSLAALFFGTALIFLGIYILRFEKWAVVLSGLYALASLINVFFITKLIGGGLMSFLTCIPPCILIINWLIFKQK